MKYECPLLAVRDIEKSKEFYRTVLGLEVIEDLGANVTLTGGIALQSFDTWKEFIHKQENEISFGGNDSELYFEEDNMDAFIEKLSQIEIEYVHTLTEHAWGQRVVRFYDLDRHIIEVGEAIQVVVSRFLNSGLSAEQTAERMDVPIEYVRAYMQ